MSTPKVILVVLATVVIFSAGLVTGGLLVKQTLPSKNNPPPGMARFDGLRRALEDAQLNLRPEQRRRIEGIFQEKRELIADYFSIIDPELKFAFRSTLDEVRAQLTPEQRQRFEEIGRQRMQMRRNRNEGFNPNARPGDAGFGPMDDRLPPPEFRNRGPFGPGRNPPRPFPPEGRELPPPPEGTPPTPKSPAAQP